MITAITTKIITPITTTVAIAQAGQEVAVHVDNAKDPIVYLTLGENTYKVSCFLISLAYDINVKISNVSIETIYF